MIRYEEGKIYEGSRGNDFRELIRKVLQRGKLLPKYIDFLTNKESIKEYGKAFTAESADVINNSEVFEQLGDLSANKFIVWYMYRRFPQLNCAEGVKVVARIRINYGAKQSFFDIANNLGFWPYISASEEERARRMKPLLEDSLEAFIGVTEYLLDEKFRPGVGYAIVYDILASIFNEMHISLKYEDLYDAKTRLKEVFDFYKGELGALIYEEEKNDLITTSKVYRILGEDKKNENTPSNRKFLLNFLEVISDFVPHNIMKKIDYHAKIYPTNKVDWEYIYLGEGSAALKADAQQRAAAVALETLRKQGYKKDPAEIYKYFCT